METKAKAVAPERFLRRRTSPVKYVYILQSLQEPGRFYTGITDDLDNRLSKHNSGSVTHTAKNRPWSIKTYVAFTDEARASAFEKYLKSGSGRAFAKMHL
jgi:predicted GIY-YIG superfamily endonuclease